jgi:hypothetical protein
VTTTLLLAGVIVLIGSAVQGVLGYGLNLLSGPVLTLMDPALVPVPVLLVACCTAVMAGVREGGSPATCWACWCWRCCRCAGSTWWSRRRC